MVAVVRASQDIGGQIHALYSQSRRKNLLAEFANNLVHGNRNFTKTLKVAN